MEPKRRRTSVVGLATLLFLVTSLNSTPSVPSVPEPDPDLPTPAEIATLERLADWLTGGSDRGKLVAMSAADLAAAIRNEPQTFEIFRRYNNRETRRRYLAAYPYGPAIYDAAQRHGLDSLLLASVVEVESNFSAAAVSPRGAVGLMQVMPTTGSDYGAEDLADPAINLEIGSRYLAQLLRQYSGDLELALAAYNAGPGRVGRYAGVPPYGETRGFVDKVLTRYVEKHRRVWDATGTTELFALR